MQRLKTRDATIYQLDAEGMDHLNALIKLLERSAGGMKAEEVRMATDSMRRLRQALVRTAAPGAEPPAV